MTYVPNTIGVSTHGVDLLHHGLRICERTPKSPMEPPQGEERERKNEREEEKERGASALFCTEIASDRLVRLFHELHQNIWRDTHELDLKNKFC
jgi:hypothetical protein